MKVRVRTDEKESNVSGIPERWIAASFCADACRLDYGTVIDHVQLNVINKAPRRRSFIIYSTARNSTNLRSMFFSLRKLSS